MIIKTTIRATVNPKALTRKCTRAEHAVAVQAERDSRPYIPSETGKLRSSGKVYGNTIVWNVPYAREMYFGHLHVDPKRKIAGFPVPGGWRSFRGQKKIRSTRKFHYKSGGDQWFTKAKKAKIGSWLQLAQGVISRG